MEGNIDQHIREKLQDREIHPSASAWERLSVQLDENQSKKKRHWFLYVGYAASILLLVSLFMLINNSDKDDSIVPEMILVEDDITKPEIDKSKEFISIPKEEVIVQNDKQDINPVKVESTEKNQDQKKIEKRIKKQTPFVTNTRENSVIASQEKKKESKVYIKKADFNKKLKEITKKEETVVAKTTDTKSEIETKLSNGRISVDSDALLMSVTGSKEEVRAYYKKYKIDRAEVLLAIQKELKKSKVKVNPETILAEVELEVNEENFQNNFYQFIKKRVSTVATAIANRNN